MPEAASELRVIESRSRRSGEPDPSASPAGDHPASAPRAGAPPSERARGTGMPDSDVVFDRVLFLRHLAIFAGAVVAYLQQSKLGIGWVVFAVVASSGALNLVASFLHRRPGRQQAVEIGSSVVGVACWTALVAVTGGVTSPFIAGLWLEIILAAMLFALAGVVAVTVWSILGLSLLHLTYGAEGLAATLALNCAFLAGMGALTYWIASRALHTEQRLVQERDELDERMHHLEVQLGHEREVGRLGENVARLAHGLKNAIHSLRGFVRLIEPTLGDRSDAAAALAGLRTAIDDLESLARITLEPGAAQRAPTGATAGPRCGAADVVQRALREVAFGHPEVVGSVEGDLDGQELPIASDDLFEVLVILMRNGVEAMAGTGRLTVALSRRDGEACIAVRDEGPGLPAEDAAQIFEPGYTTKPGGSGYGLFLARRIVVQAGGRLSAARAGRRGALMQVTFPLTRGTDPVQGRL